MKKQTQICQVELQAIFDINGLDSFRSDSSQLTIKNGVVSVDAKFCEYCRPFTEAIINHINLIEDELQD